MRDIQVSQLMTLLSSKRATDRISQLIMNYWYMMYGAEIKEESYAVSESDVLGTSEER
jgi:hypothetical protein